MLKKTMNENPDSLSSSSTTSPSASSPTSVDPFASNPFADHPVVSDPIPERYVEPASAKLELPKLSAEESTLESVMSADDPFALRNMGKASREDMPTYLNKKASLESPVTDDMSLVQRLAAVDWTLDEYNALSEATITVEEIEVLRCRAKVPRPPNITCATWDQPIELAPRHRVIINMAALGHSNHAIGEKIGMSSDRVGLLLASNTFKRKVALKQAGYLDGSAKAALKLLLGKAFRAVEEILDNPDEKSSVRLEASKFVIDHVVGKASQSVDIKSSTLSEFMRRLDEVPAYAEPTSPGQVIDAVATAKPILQDAKALVDTESKPSSRGSEGSDDNIDAIVNSFSPVVVGKRDV